MNSSIKIGEQIAFMGLKQNAKNLYGVTERLSTGYQINRAADNAAGLKISNKMRAQIRGLSQASRNIQDGVSLCQVAEGILGQVTQMCQRMRELAVAAYNDTNTKEDREALNEEAKQLISEVENTLKEAEWNGKKIWDRDTAEKELLGYQYFPAVIKNDTSFSSILTDQNKFSLPQNGYIRLSANEEGIQMKWDAYNGKTYVSSIVPWDEELSGDHSFQLKDYIDCTLNPELTGINCRYTYTIADYATLEDVIKSFDQAVVGFSPNCSEICKPFYDDKGKANALSFSVDFYYSALLASGKTFDLYDTIFVEPLVEKNLVNDPTDMNADSDLWKFKFFMPGIGSVTAESKSTYYYSTWKDPDKKWWGRYIYDGYIYDYTRLFTPIPSGGSLPGVIDALNNDRKINLLDDTISGGYIEIHFSLEADNPYMINGQTYNNVGKMEMQIRVRPGDTVDDIVDQLHNLNGMDFYAGDETTKAPSNSYYNSTGHLTGYKIPFPIYKAVNRVHIQAGANKEQEIEIVYDSLSIYQLGLDGLDEIDGIDLTEIEKDRSVIEKMDKAIEMINSNRSQWGAYQNRLEHAWNQAENTGENLSYAESRICDVDMEKEVVELQKQKLLQSASEALMAQMKERDRDMVVQLLKGN